MSIFDPPGDVLTAQKMQQFNIECEKREQGLDELEEKVAKFGIEHFFRGKSRYKWEGEHPFLSPLEAAAKAKSQKSKTLKETLEKRGKVTKVTEIKKVKTISSKRQKGG